MTFTATLTLPAPEARALAAAIAEDPAFETQSVDAAEGPHDWQVVVYFEDAPSLAALDRLDALALEVAGRAVSVESTALPETDWVAKSLAGLAPVRAGRFLIHGSHDRHRRKENDLAIEIEAGQAFGTGHHGSTTGCLIAIDRLAKQRRIGNALDVGTGSGVLAIAIARLFHVPVLASDIDPVAVAVARDNFRANGVGRLVRPVVATGVSGRVFSAAGPYDLIVANILAGPLVALAPGLAVLTAPGGTVILSGLLATQRARVLAAYRGRGLRPKGDVRLGEWSTLVLERPGRR